MAPSISVVVTAYSNSKFDVNVILTTRIKNVCVFTLVSAWNHHLGLYLLRIIIIHPSNAETPG